MKNISVHNFVDFWSKQAWFVDVAESAVILLPSCLRCHAACPEWLGQAWISTKHCHRRHHHYRQRHPYLLQYSASQNNHLHHHHPPCKLAQWAKGSLVMLLTKYFIASSSPIFVKIFSQSPVLFKKTIVFETSGIYHQNIAFGTLWNILSFCKVYKNVSCFRSVLKSYIVCKIKMSYLGPCNSWLDDIALAPTSWAKTPIFSLCRQSEGGDLCQYLEGRFRPWQIRKSLTLRRNLERH